MLIFEAQEEIKERIKLKDDYKDMPMMLKYFEALEMADKALDAQNRLAEMLNDFYAEDEEKHKGDIYSRRLVMELLECIRWDYLEAKDD